MQWYMFYVAHYSFYLASETPSYPFYLASETPSKLSI